MFRELPSDYGLDGQVEVFDANGRATGRLFFVQLKGTQSGDGKRALAVGLRVDTVHYFLSLDLPVLLVRYVGPSDTIYARWVHRFAPIKTQPQQKTKMFRFHSDDRWGRDAMRDVPAEIDRVRDFRHGQPTAPYLVHLEFAEDEVRGLAKGYVTAAARKEVEAYSGLLVAERGRRLASHVWVEVKSATVDVATITGGSIGIPLVGDDAESLARSVLVGVGLVLGRTANQRLAAEILDRSFEVQRWVGCPGVASMSVATYVRGGRVEQALRVCRALIDTDDLVNAADILSWLAIAEPVALTESDRDQLVSEIERSGDLALERGDIRKSATCYYNIGNFVRASDGRAGLRYYRKAARADPSYVGRDYFLAELAGVCFDLGRFRFAARFYRRALTLSKDPETRGLYADALLFAGEYEEAEAEFDVYVGESVRPLPEWRLKLVMVRLILKVLGLRRQRRNAGAALSLVRARFADIPTDETVLSDAFQLDALCALAWFNNGVSCKERSNDDALLSFLFAALLEKKDIEAWVNCIALCICSEEWGKLLPLIVAEAYQWGRESLFDQVERFCAEQPSTFPATLFVNTLNELVELLPRRRRPRIARAILPDGSYAVLDPVEREPKGRLETEPSDLPGTGDGAA